jgi:hypothetical protein
MVAFMGGVAGGLLFLFVASWLVAIPMRIAEWWLIVRARFGSEPRDGKRAALLGTLRGHGELTAPFSRERCVLYAYEIIMRDVIDGESTDRKAYEGFAMVPLSIEHGTERTRILARPELPKLATTYPKSRTDESNAKQFVENTTFVPAPKASAEEKDLSHTDGHLRFDYSREPLETNIGACRLVEKILPAGASVCALGTYRADRHALVAPVTLRTGTTFGIDAAWRVVNAGIAAVIFAAIALTATTIFCLNFPIDAAERAYPDWTPYWWEIDLERFLEREVSVPLADTGLLPSSGFYLEEICEGCAKGRLEIDGRTMALAHTAYRGGRTVHVSAAPGARDGVTLDGKDHVVLTVNGKSATIPPSWLQPHDIETALGSHGDYSGRITVIAPDHSIRCRVSFATKVDADAWLPSRAGTAAR